MTEVLDHWINGAAAAGASTRTAPVYNPAEGTVSREVRSPLLTSIQADPFSFSLG